MVLAVLSDQECMFMTCTWASYLFDRLLMFYKWSSHGFDSKSSLLMLHRRIYSRLGQGLTVFVGWLWSNIGRLSPLFACFINMLFVCPLLLTSRWWRSSWGVSQGCVLYPILLVQCEEILCWCMRKCFLVCLVCWFEPVQYCSFIFWNQGSLLP